MLKLRIAELCEGHSAQTYHVSAQNLDLLDWEEFQSPIDIQLEIEKNGDQTIICANLQTTVDFICDRCLEPFTNFLNENVNLLYTTDIKFKDEEDDDVFYISPSVKEIDLVDPLRQILILALPAKRLCKEDCNGLCPHCGANLNTTKCQCPTEHIDPRWEKLKKLLS